MKTKINKDYESPEFDDVLQEEKEATLFEIGQGYEKEPAKVLSCKKCGGTTFIVGIGSYFTALSCPNCKYQLCIHDG